MTNVRYPTNDAELLKSKIGDAESAAANFFDGRFNSQKLIIDPFISGYAFIFWTKLPTWVTSEYPEFREMSQRTMRDFSGVSDQTLATEGYTLGFSSTEEQIASGISGDNGFSLQYQEFSGSPITSATNHWVGGIRDPATNVPTYPKNFNVDYGARNHTGEMLYVVMRPDVNTGAKAIESATYYTNVHPLKIIGDYLNYSAGSQAGQVLTQEYTGNRWQGKKVLAYAESVVDATSMVNTTSHSFDFDPSIGAPL